MLLLLIGISVLLLTVGTFVVLLPRSGKLHRWTDTEWEPYVCVALCAGLALGFTMALSGVMNLMSTS